MPCIFKDLHASEIDTTDVLPPTPPSTSVANNNPPTTSVVTLSTSIENNNPPSTSVVNHYAHLQDLNFDWPLHVVNQVLKANNNNTQINCEHDARVEYENARK